MPSTSYVYQISDLQWNMELPWKESILGLLVTHYVFQLYINIRQYKMLQRPKPPAILADKVTQEAFCSSQAYNQAKIQFSIVSDLWFMVLTAAIVYFDLLPKLWTWTGRLMLAWMPTLFAGEMAQSITFVIFFLYIQQAISIPPNILETFVLEEAYNFNRQSTRTFVLDILKTSVITTILIIPCLGIFLMVIDKTGENFALYLWGATAIFSLIIGTIHPVLILPLFLKVSPLEAGEVKNRIEVLSKKMNYPLSRISVLNGSSRSSHSNAILSGLPWQKQILLFDTLLEQMNANEIVAIVAHELGHWKFDHNSKLFVISQLHQLCIFWLFSIVIHNGSLYSSLGFKDDCPIVGAFILFCFTLPPVNSLLQLISNTVTRRFEYQADDFAKGLGYKSDLSDALIKLHLQNLSTTIADSFYSSYHHNHPLVSDRLQALGYVGKEE